MNGPAEYGCVLFDATQAAIRAEKTLKAAGLRVKLIPVPRQLSADCGVCIRFVWAERAQVEAFLRAAGVPIAGVQRLQNGG